MENTITRQVLKDIKASVIKDKRKKTTLSREPLNKEIKEHLQKIGANHEWERDTNTNAKKGCLEKVLWKRRLTTIS